MVLERPNECGDFGAWGDFFEKLGPAKKKYKRFMFINDTVRGPFINPHFLLFAQVCLSSSFFWWIVWVPHAFRTELSLAN